MSAADVPFRRVAVVGLGVMGGGLVRGLRRLATPPRVAGWTPDREEAARVRAAAVVDALPSTVEETVREAELVVLATPLEAAVELLETSARVAPPTAVLADVASLKVPLERAARRAGVSARWVGCHPMAGSEASGFDASAPDLYRGSTVWITAGASAASAARRVSAMWEALGARPRAVTAPDHDARMALVSHLPQLMANALARVLERHGVGAAELGPGGRGMTRLAGSSPAMWRDLLLHAPAGLAPSLREAAEILAEMAAGLDEGSVDDLTGLMERTRTWRERT